MKINKLTATFGKFINESISFHGGLNIIEAPNESGKTTWCAFIMAMLYGVDSAERTKAGSLPVRQRYAPWSGAPMEGTAELTADNCDITIMRSTRLKNAPMREFSAFYTGTGIPVEKLSGSNAGELLTGVSRDVFARSAFVGQGAAALTGSPEMEKRIQAIFSTGEEEKTAETIRTSEEQLNKCEADCSTLEAEVIQARKEHRNRLFREINSTRTEARQLADEQNAALEELSDRRDDLRQSLFGRRKAELVEAEAEEDIRRLEALKEENRTNFFWIPTFLLFLCAFAGVVLYQQLFPYTAVIIAAAAMCLGAIVFLSLYVRRRAAINEAQGEIDRILRKYKAENAQDITLRLDDHHARYVAARRAEDKARSASAAADAAYEKLSKLESRVSEELEGNSGNAEEISLGRELAEKRNEAARLSSQIAMEKGRLAVIGDPVIMKSDLERLEKEQAQLQEEAEAIEMAKAVLKDADDEIQSRFSPELGKIAAEYMSFVTGGRYEGVLLNRDFSAMAKTTDDTVARKSEYLSAGTVDLLYLAVRLAVCELALPDGETCPLIIDDALVNMDETRYAQALKLLGEIAKERQVILFTCRR